MGLFGKGFSSTELNEAASKTSVVIDGLSSIFLDAIIENTTDYISKMGGRSHLAEEGSLGIYGLPKKTKGLIALRAYCLWGVGAFLQGQHLANYDDLRRFTDAISPLLCPSEHTQYFQDQFDFVRGNESDKVLQASLLLGDMLLMLDITDLSVDSEIKVKIVSYHVPLLELLLGYLALHLDNVFRQSNVTAQVKMVEEYEKASRATYRMNFNKARQLLAIPKWT